MKFTILDKETEKKIKPWAILSTYVVVLVFVLANIQGISSGIGFFLSILKSLVYAIIFAYVLNLPMKHIENFMMKHTKTNGFIQKKKRIISMLLTFVFAIILMSIIVSIILPSIIGSLVSLMKNLTDFFVNIVQNIDGILAYFHIDFKIEEIASVEKFISMPWEDVVKSSINILTGSASGILSSASSFVSSFAVVFTGFMFSLYLLSGKEAFLRQMRKTVAAFLGYDKSVIVFDYAHRVNQTFSNFIGGQLTEACILWVLYYIGMRLFNFPFPELICTLIAVCSMVPVFGSMFAMSIGAIMMLSVDPLKSVYFILFYQVLSYFEDSVIYPRVVGNSVGLPGLWVLLSIFVFGDLWGVFGMIMAVPTTACLYVFFAEFINKRLKKKNLVITDTTMEKETENT